MLANVLVIAFVSVYCAIVMLGHVLLVHAMWPGLFTKRPAPRHENGGQDETAPGTPDVRLPPRLAA